METQIMRRNIQGKPFLCVCSIALSCPFKKLFLQSNIAIATITILYRNSSLNKASLEKTRAKVERKNWLRPWIQLTSFFLDFCSLTWICIIRKMKESWCSKFITVTQVSLVKARKRSPKDKRIHARMIVSHGKKFLQLIMWEFWPAL